MHTATISDPAPRASTLMNSEHARPSVARRAAIVGAAGYAGAELVGLLQAHPHLEPVALFGSPGSDGGRFDDLHPRYRTCVDAAIQPWHDDAPRSLARDLDADMVFLATPPSASHAIADELLDRGLVVFDLSAAFRHASAETFETHYGFAPPDPSLLLDAVYALPECYGGALGAHALYALPGCYPTATILAASPLVRAGLTDPARPIVVDATSGVSGAGRAPSARTHFCGVSHEPYGVWSHRHTPEMTTHIGQDVIFTPHLGPWDRGILATIHVDLRAGTADDDCRHALQQAYADAPFVRVLPEGQWPSVAAVRGTNFCDIGIAVDPARGHAIVISAIDNLLKGAAGQAVQVMNRHYGFPETSGLPGPVASCTMEVTS